MCSDEPYNVNVDCNKYKYPRFVEATIEDSCSNNDITTRQFWEQKTEIIGLAYDKEGNKMLILDTDRLIVKNN